MVTIAHISDLHIDGGERSIERTRSVMDYINSLPVALDAVVVTGDVADHGLPAEYECARELLASRHPVLACPGNHDERTAFRRHLLGQPADSGPINQVHHADGFVLALCDSTVPGENRGRLDDETMTWLDGVAGARTAPLLVGFHHPPATLHAPYVDGIRQFDAHRLTALAARHQHLAAFLAGHAHTPAATWFAGRPLLVAPGLVSTLRLTWEEQAHPGHHVHHDLPPALAFHVLDEEARLTTHYRVIGH